MADEPSGPVIEPWAGLAGLAVILGAATAVLVHTLSGDTRAVVTAVVLVVAVLGVNAVGATIEETLPPAASRRRQRPRRREHLLPASLERWNARLAGPDDAEALRVLRTSLGAPAAALTPEAALDALEAAER